MRKLIVLLASVALSAVAMAQLQPMSPIPEDKDVRHGKLENGMSYYIRHCDKQKNLADFYIYHDVGAIQENDSQQGLAHFLEHMAFNGTKNLPGKMLIEYLEKVGVKFGANLNAGTSWDMTQYLMKDVPTLREGTVDSALLVLHDWSSFIALEPKEIDAERGVIMEELRTRDNGEWRSVISMLKTFCRGTKYEQRNLIGYLDGLKSFNHSAIENFYHTWYRPDYQCLVVVGDIDVDRVYSKIEKLMADIPAAPASAPKKEVIVVPDNKEPIVTVFEDPELTNSMAQVAFKHPAIPAQMRNKVVAEQLDIINDLGSSMASSRFREMMMKPDAPFTSAGLSCGEFGVCSTLDMVVTNALTKDGGLNRGIEALCREVERIARFGFTDSEFERAKADMLRSMEEDYINRNDKKNGAYVQEYISAFSRNTPIPDAKTKWQLDSVLVKNIPLEAVNMTFKNYLTSGNEVVFVKAPKKDGVKNPTEAEILEIIDRVSKEEITPYEDNTVKEPLIKEGTVLKGSPVKKTAQNKELSVTEWTLKNGVKVYVKPTAFKADEVLVEFVSHAGVSSFPDSDMPTLEMLPVFVSRQGVDRFSMTDLRKQLTGKNASLYPVSEDYKVGFSGNGSPRDFETLMQLLYLQFTSPRFSKDDFDATLTQMHSYIDNMVTNPDFLAQKRITSRLFCDSDRRAVTTSERLDRISFEKMQELYGKIFASARDFTLFIVGNVDPETIRPLVEKYVGSLPAAKNVLRRVDSGLKTLKGEVNETFTEPMEQPKVGVYRIFSGPTEYTLKNVLGLSFVSQLLSTRYVTSIREEKGGTYGVHVRPVTEADFTPHYLLQIMFDTNEQMADELTEIVMKEIRDLADNGPKEDELEKVRSFMLKEWKNQVERNSVWVNLVDTFYYRHINNFALYEPTVKNLTAADIQVLVKKILADGNMLHMMMRPEKKTDK